MGNQAGVFRPSMHWNHNLRNVPSICSPVRLHSKPSVRCNIMTLASVGNQGRDSDLADDSTLKRLSPMAKEVFKEAQENILALNRSRLKALEELKAAREKIAELERKLEEATQQVTALTTIEDVPTSIVSFNGNNSSNGTATGGAVMYSFDTQNPTQTSKGSTVGQPPASIQGHSSPKSTIVLLYETGWDEAYFHCNKDGTGWTALPGIPVPVASEGEFVGKKVMNLDCSKVEFVLTNGYGKFDTPNPYGEPGVPNNYVIDAPGKYRLKSGRLAKLE